MFQSLLLAQDDTLVGFWRKATFGEAILATAAFGALGVALLFIGYKIFDLLTPHLHIEKELAEKNVAVAIVVATMLISLSIIVARTIG
jgi:putative membrane protein